MHSYHTGDLLAVNRRCEVGWNPPLTRQGIRPSLHCLVRRRLHENEVVSVRSQSLLATIGGRKEREDVGSFV